MRTKHFGRFERQQIRLGRKVVDQLPRHGKSYGCQSPMSVDETCFVAYVVKKRTWQTSPSPSAKRHRRPEEGASLRRNDDPRHCRQVRQSVHGVVADAQGPPDFKAAVLGSTMFDEEDAKAVQKEIDALDNQKIQKYQALNNGRLELLKKYDELLGMKKNFPKMNRFFVKKQQQIIDIVQRLGSPGRVLHRPWLARSAGAVRKMIGSHQGRRRSP